MHAEEILLVLSCFGGYLAAGAAHYAHAPAEYAADVAALQPLRALVKASNVSLAGWSSSSSSLEPCGSPNCSTQQGLGVPECAWEGVTCQNGRVTSVRLACGERHPCVNRIHGRLPASLGNLTALQVLCLRDNALTGSLPPGEGWSSLQQLDLHGNSISSTLPPQWGAGLPQLTDLDLSYNQLTGYLPWTWGEFSSLSQMDLSGNKLSGGIPVSWSSLGSLKVLLLSDNCAMCGGIPLLHAKLTARNTSLGAACNPSGGCGAPSHSGLMIALSVLLGSLALCLLQRHICWRCRVAALLAEAERLDAQAQREGRTAGRKPRQLLRRIPSFEACVELRGDGGKSSHHGKAAAAAARSAEAPPQQQQQQQQQQQAEVIGDLAAGPTAAAAHARDGADSSSPAQQQQQQQQQQQHTGAAGSVPRPASPGAGQVVHEPPPAFSVIVMPDGQHLALAVPEIDSVADIEAPAQSSQGSIGQASAEPDAQQPQQQQQQEQQQQQRRPVQGAVQRAGRALLGAVVYLFVQPVPSASDFEQAYGGPHGRGSSGAAIL
ncbi:hypothetical protein OEZ86_001929 [Tetradesmus obliquus]|nr:hypothetical protein OEZ86_001929 [Tetradesmus obliquus]